MWSQVLQTSPWRTSGEAGEAGQITHLLVLGCTGSPRIHWRSQGTKITARRGWQSGCSYPSSSLNHTAWCWKQEVTLAALHPQRLRRSLLADSEGLKTKVPLWWTADGSGIWSYTSLSHWLCFSSYESGGVAPATWKPDEQKIRSKMSRVVK